MVQSCQKSPEMTENYRKLPKTTKNHIFLTKNKFKIPFFFHQKFDISQQPPCNCPNNQNIGHHANKDATSTRQSLRGSVRPWILVNRCMKTFGVNRCKLNRRGKVKSCTRWCWCCRCARSNLTGRRSASCWFRRNIRRGGRVRTSIRLRER